MKNRFSVIVPAYNVEKYLGKCLDSLLDQDFPSYEIIVVDDGSSDGSFEAAKAYEEKAPDKIRIIRQENKGLGGARNTGIDAADGEYLLFVDSDDTVEKNTLSKLNEKIEETGADIIVFDYAYTDEIGNVLSIAKGCPEDRAPSIPDESNKLLLMSPSACNKAYKSELFKNTDIRFPEHLWFEDLATILKLYPLCKKVEYLPNPFYLYLQRSGSIMHDAKKAEKNLDIITAVKSFTDFYKERGLFDRYNKEIEYLSVFHIYVLASVRVIKGGGKKHILEELKNFIHENFPNFKDNEYCKNMTKKEKLIIKLLEENHTAILKLLLRINELTK